MTPRRPAPGPRYEALVQLLQTADTLWSASRVLFNRWGLNPSAFNILYVLDGEPEGLTQVELSRRLLVHPSNVTGLVDRMEKRGLVERREAPDDRRAYQVVLAAEGTKLLKRILPVYYEVAEHVWGRLSLERTRRLVFDLAEVSARTERIAASMTGPAPEKG